MGASVEAIEEELARSGVAATAVGATIRLAGTLDASHAETIAAPSAATTRSWPRLSVDLRGSVDGREERPPAAPGAHDLEVREVLGEGGMGRVFVAHQRSIGREVAVKTARDGADPAAASAILEEGRVTGQLEHPGIVPVHALGVDESGRPVMVMKRVEGVSWRALAEDASHPGWEGWEGDERERLPGHLQILVSLCNALSFAHSRGVVHRDVKLDNVLIGRFGDVYLADWGVAGRVGESEARLCGTPGYMAPEMVRGGRIDERTDVYLLGATLHELLTGTMRHARPTALGALTASCLSEAFEYAPTVPTELAALANAACSLDPEDRPAGAKAFRDALTRHLGHREAARLAADAMERFAQLEALLASESADEEQRRAIDRLTAEVRYGLDRALERWPDNAPARATREALEAILEARSARAAALERDARERDPRTAARLRAGLLAFLALLGVLMGVVAVTTEGALSPLELILFPGFLGGVMIGGLAVFHRRLLRTRFNREVTALVFLVIALMLAGRTAGLFVPIEAHEHFVRDSFMMAGGFGVGAIAYLRWAGWVAAVFFLCGMACLVAPEHALQIFGVSSAAGVVLATAFSWRER